MLKFSLIACPLLLSHNIVFAQKQNPSQNVITYNTSTIKKQKHGLFSFVSHLFHKNNKKPSYDYTRKKTRNRTDTTASKKSPKSEPFELTKGSITWTSLYTEGVNLNTGINGLYSIGTKNILN